MELIQSLTKLPTPKKSSAIQGTGLDTHDAISARKALLWFVLGQKFDWTSISLSGPEIKMGLYLPRWA
jgi:hypothetical protein